MLDLCSKEIRLHQIDEWEPSLAVEVAQSLYRCRRSLAGLEKQPAPEQLEALRKTYARGCANWTRWRRSRWSRRESK